ncbi:MAG: hypothetical protein M3Z56_11620 [Bacteroidota bacterium]|nr:hypothetical protein [Bacteroidota bacterium]
MKKLAFKIAFRINKIKLIVSKDTGGYITGKTSHIISEKNVDYCNPFKRGTYFYTMGLVSSIFKGSNVFEYVQIIVILRNLLLELIF